MVPRSLVVAFVLLLFASTAVEGAVPLSQPIDPAPLGEASDPATPVALLEVDGTPLSVFQVLRGNPKYVAPEIYARPMSHAGEPATPAQQFLGAGRYPAAASNGSAALVVYAGNGVEATLIDSDARILAGPVKLSDRGPAVSFFPGVTRTHVAATAGGWFVAWDYSEYSANAYRSGTELVELNADLSFRTAPRSIPPPSAFAGNGAVAAAIMNSSTGVLVSRPGGVPTAVSEGQSHLLAAAWTVNVLGVALARGATIEFVTLDDDLDVLARRTTPLDVPCATLTLAANGTGWAALCSSNTLPADAWLLFFDADGGFESKVQAPGLSGAVPAFAAGRLRALAHDRIYDIDTSGIVARGAISSRAANSRIAPLHRWGNGDRLAITEVEGDFFANLITPSGELRFPQPVSLGHSPHPGFVTAAHGDRIHLVRPKEAGKLEVLTFDRTAATPLPAMTSVSLADPAYVAPLIAAAAGEGGLAVLFRQQNGFAATLLLLNAALQPIDERAIVPSNNPGVAMARDRVFVTNEYDGLQLEVFDLALQLVKARRQVAPAIVNPQSVLSSAAHGRVLLTWINAGDHIRTIVVDAEGEIVGGADGGRIVTSGSQTKYAINAHPTNEGWRISWAERPTSLNSTVCSSQTFLNRIDVDREGKLVTPLPHEPHYTFTPGFCADPQANLLLTWEVSLAREGDAVTYTVARVEQPYGGARRAVVQIAQPTSRRRPAR